MKQLFENWREYTKKEDNILEEVVGFPIFPSPDDIRDMITVAAGAGIEKLFKTPQFRGFMKAIAYSPNLADLHVRAFAKFLAHDTSTLTEEFFTEAERRHLGLFIAGADFIQWLSLKDKRISAKAKASGLTSQTAGFPLADSGQIVIQYKDYDMVTRGNRPKVAQSMMGGKPYEQIERFLGQFIVTRDDGGLHISDNYDFSGRRFNDLKNQLVYAVRRSNITKRDASGARGEMDPGEFSFYKLIRKMAPHPGVGTPYKIDINLDYDYERLLVRAKHKYRSKQKAD